MLRTLVRDKAKLVAERGDWLRRMQKSLDQMNVRVHRAVSDLDGVTGMAILRAIAGGEREAQKLAQLRDPRCNKTESESGDVMFWSLRAPPIVTTIATNAWNFLGGGRVDLFQRGPMCRRSENVRVRRPVLPVTRPEWALVCDSGADPQKRGSELKEARRRCKPTSWERDAEQVPLHCHAHEGIHLRCWARAVEVAQQSRPRNLCDVCF
jgi:hypothetical protein